MNDIEYVYGITCLYLDLSGLYIPLFSTTKQAKVWANFLLKQRLMSGP